MLDQLLSVLAPTAVVEDIFTATNMHPRAPRVYGGQVLAQALRAASATVAGDREVHSQHAYFLRPGNPAEPIQLEVERALDGGSLSSRRVVALQRGKPILVCSVSFQRPGRGEQYQQEMPVVPAPETLPDERERALANDEMDEDFMIATGGDLDMRLVNPVDWRKPVTRPAHLEAWMKTSAPVADHPGLHAALLAYMSDTLMVDVCLLANGVSYLQPELQVASLDHALWFHSPIRADEWLLHTVEAEHVGGGRGLARGRFYTRDGVLVASVAQQALMRYR